VLNNNYIDVNINSKQFKPIFEEAAVELKDSNIRLAIVDVDQEKILATKYKILQIPSLYYYREGLIQ
jgi:thioredoxin-like negative regulator of GroEL